MRKTWMILPMILLLAACTDDKSSENNTTNADSNKQVTESEDPNNSETEEEAETAETEDNEAGYTDDEYHFSADMPEEWKGSVEVTKGNWKPDAERTVDFVYPGDDGNLNEILCSIVIYDGDTDAEGSEEEFHLGEYLGEQEIDGNVKSYAFLLPPEPSEEILQPGNEDEFKQVSELIKHAEVIKETFTFTK